MKLKKWLILLAPLALVLAIAVVRSNPLTAKAQAVKVVMLPATVKVSEEVTTATANTLEKELERLGVSHFAITNVDDGEQYYTVSVAGLPDSAVGKRWTIEDAAWLGSVTLAKVSGLPGVVNADPEIPPQTQPTPTPAPRGLRTAPQPDTLPDSAGTGIGGSGNILPWRSGTQAQYGMLGVHNCGYSMTGWKAVDLFPSENQVYATQGGDVSYVCRDSTQVSMRIGSNIYAHLVDTGQSTGQHYEQGQALGGLVPGTFNDTCGYADQQAAAYHLHFCFVPNPSSGSWSADGYVLNIGNNNWQKGNEVVAPTGYLTADWVSAGVNTPGPTAGSNFWDLGLAGIWPMVTGATNALPTHPDMQIATKVIGQIQAPLKLVYALVLSVFDMTIPIWVVGIIIALEAVRLIYAGWMWIKRAIPVVG